MTAQLNTNYLYGKNPLVVELLDHLFFVRLLKVILMDGCFLEKYDSVDQVSNSPKLNIWVRLSNSNLRRKGACKQHKWFSSGRLSDFTKAPFSDR